MRSRWFHDPTLHAPISHHDEKKVTWLELFYDLIFVAAIIQLGDYLSHEATLSGFGLFALHFAPLWLAWTGFTFYANRYTVDDFLHRALVLTMMFSMGTMAIASHQAMGVAIVDGEMVSVTPEPTMFSLAFSVALGIVALLHLRTWLQEPNSRDYSRYWGLVFTGGAASFLLSALLPHPWCYLLWAVGIGGILSSPISKPARALSEQYPLDMEHLSERYGLLTIIVLGESFVKVLTYLTSGYGPDAEYLFKGFFNLALTCSIWWIYFDDVADSEVKEDRGSWVFWLYGHLPLTMAITGVGVAVKKAIGFDLFEPAYYKYRWLLAGTLALTFLSVALIDAVTERKHSEMNERNRVNSRLAMAALILLLGAVGHTMSAAAFLGLVAALCAAQVIFDMAMAPFGASTDDSHHAVSTAELARRHRPGAPVPGAATKRADISQAVRKGAPAELRKDLYFFFMEGTWTRLIMSFVFLYIFLNVFFAGLYTLDQGALGGDELDFATAFYFSVQTISTIGFGALSPATEYADLLVTAEACVGILFVALATGLMFAKASRPQSSVLFSECAVITTRNGVPTIQLRMANARGNEVVDATATVSALMEEVTPEGHHLRRVIDLKLARDRSPMFVLSWSVFHAIDEDSALHGIDPEEMESRLQGLIVTLMGHDGTYGQTTYARHIYYADDIRVGHRFVDVISQLPDGRLMIDLEKFHDTLPDEHAMAEIEAALEADAERHAAEREAARADGSGEE